MTTPRFRFASPTRRLLTKVRAYLASYDVTATVAYGKRALDERLNQGPGRANRIVFVAHEPRSGAGGKLLGQPSQVGDREIPDPADPSVVIGLVRALADWERGFTVSVWAHDGDRPSDEEAQVIAAEELLEWAVRAVHQAGFGEVSWGAVGVVVQGVRPFGHELRAAMTLSHPLYDVPREIEPAGLRLTREMANPNDDADDE